MTLRLTPQQISTVGVKLQHVSHARPDRRAPRACTSSTTVPSPSTRPAVQRAEPSRPTVELLRAARRGRPDARARSRGEHRAFDIGSPNRYSTGPGQLAEYGHVVDDTAAAAVVAQDHWTLPWTASGRTAVRGTPDNECQ